MATKKQLLNAADKLDAARELMNHGGKHWIKGALRKFVPKSHKPGEFGFSLKQQAGPDCEVGYCSYGALNKVKAPYLAKKTLQDVIYDKYCLSVIGLNDAAETKWGDVSRAFRKAAAHLRREAEKL